MKILIIRLSSIGDCVLASPVVEALRDRYPHAQISWAVQSKSAPVVVGMPGLGGPAHAPGTILWDDRAHKWRELSCSLWRTWRSQFDVALDLQGLDKAGLFSMATHAKRRVSGARARRIARWTSTERVLEDEFLHARLFYLRRARSLDIAADYATRYYPRVPLTDAHRTFAAQFLANHGFEPSQRLIGLNLGAAHAIKRWPAGRFAQLALELLRDDRKTRIVLFGAPADKILEEQFLEAWKEIQPTRNQEEWDNRLVSAVGKLDLMQMAAAAGYCRAFVTADTGPMHIVAATGAPIVALFGPTDTKATGPVHKPGAAPIRVLDARNLTGQWPASMDTLDVNLVLNEVRELLLRTESLVLPAFLMPAASPTVASGSHSLVLPAFRPTAAAA